MPGNAKTVPLPRAVKISPSLVCNLRCPLCPAGVGGMSYRTKLMRLETFLVVLGKLPASVKRVSLFNQGEPFLNPDLLRMVAAAKHTGRSVDIHSNFSFRRESDFFTELVKSRLDALIVSIDGASQAAYSKYRVGGDFQRVLANLRALLEARARLAAPCPAVVWKFLVNRHNEHQIAEAREIAGALGIELVTDLMGLADDLPDFDVGTPLEARMRAWLPENVKFVKDRYQGPLVRPLSSRPCAELFLRPVIKPDGKVVPCCWITDERNAFGDLLRDSFEDVWHSAVYSYSRSLYGGEAYRGRKVRTVCSECTNFTRSGTPQESPESQQAR